MLVKFVRRTFTAYPPGFTPPDSGTPLPRPPLLPRSLFTWVRRFCIYCPPCQTVQSAMLPSGLLIFSGTWRSPLVFFFFVLFLFIL